MALSKKRRYRFSRDLPHMQRAGRPLFVSVTTEGRWVLPPEARGIVYECCLREHERRVEMHAFVVMPEHLHLLFTPLLDPTGASYSLAEIMSGIKGASAHAVNRYLGRRGRVWQSEYFDHVVRKATADQKLQYLIENPLYARLVDDPYDYPWLWVNQRLKD